MKPRDLSNPRLIGRTNKCWMERVVNWEKWEAKLVCQIYIYISRSSRCGPDVYHARQEAESVDIYISMLAFRPFYHFNWFFIIFLLLMKPNWYCSALYVLFKLEDSSPRLPIEQAPAVGCPHIFGWIFFLRAWIPILCLLGRKEKKTDSISPNKILTVSVWYSPGSRHHFGKSQQQQQPVAEDYPDALDNSKQIFFCFDVYPFICELFYFVSFIFFISPVAESTCSMSFYPHVCYKCSRRCTATQVLHDSYEKYLMGSMWNESTGVKEWVRAGETERLLKNFQTVWLAIVIDFFLCKRVPLIRALVGMSCQFPLHHTGCLV